MKFILGFIIGVVLAYLFVFVKAKHYTWVENKKLARMNKIIDAWHGEFDMLNRP